MVVLYGVKKWNCINHLICVLPLQGGERMGEEAVLEPPRVRGKPKNCLINDKKGKKKISWQDPVALKV